MKVRWTENSVRMRITPSELESLKEGTQITTCLWMPGGQWNASVSPCAPHRGISMQGSYLQLNVTPEDILRLAAPDAEGIYFQTDTQPPIRYLIEKDFPCLHPHAGEAGETPTETFAPPPGFEERKL